MWAGVIVFQVTLQARGCGCVVKRWQEQSPTHVRLMCDSRTLCATVYSARISCFMTKKSALCCGGPTLAILVQFVSVGVDCTFVAESQYVDFVPTLK